MALRNELDLFVNVVECKSYEGIQARQKDVNIAIVRQNTEGEYAMLEHEVRPILNIVHQFFHIEFWIYFIERTRCRWEYENRDHRKFRKSSPLRIRIWYITKNQ